MIFICDNIIQRFLYATNYLFALFGVTNLPYIKETYCAKYNPLLQYCLNTPNCFAVVLLSITLLGISQQTLESMQLPDSFIRSLFMDWTTLSTVESLCSSMHKCFSCVGQLLLFIINGKYESPNVLGQNDFYSHHKDELHHRTFQRKFFFWYMNMTHKHNSYYSVIQLPTQHVLLSATETI